MAAKPRDAPSGARPAAKQRSLSARRRTRPGHLWRHDAVVDVRRGPPRGGPSSSFRPERAPIFDLGIHVSVVGPRDLPDGALCLQKVARLRARRRRYRLGDLAVPGPPRAPLLDPQAADAPVFARRMARPDRASGRSPSRPGDAQRDARRETVPRTRRASSLQVPCGLGHRGRDCRERG